MMLGRSLVHATSGALLLAGCTVVAAQVVQTVDPMADPGHRALVAMVGGVLATLVAGIWSGLRVIKTLRDDFVMLAAEEARKAAGVAVSVHNSADDVHAASRADVLAPILEKLEKIQRDQEVIATLLVERVKNVDRRLSALEAAARAGMQGHAADGRRLDALEDETPSGESSDDALEPIRGASKRSSDPDGTDFSGHRTNGGTRHRGRQ